MEQYDEKNRECGSIEGIFEGWKKAWIEGWKEGWNEGWREGRYEAAKTVALNMWNNGYKSLEKISEITKLSVDEIKKLIEENSV